jgi:hypothetical protein
VALSGRGREWLLRIGLSTGSVLLAAALGETGLRLAGFAPERFTAVGRMADAHWTMLLDCYPTNPRGYFDIDLRTAANRLRYHHIAPLRYDLMARRAPWAVESRYNALRFRDQPFGPKRPGVRRVMVLGDSFTEGEGVKEEDTTVRLLERLLDQWEPGRWEVFNCGRRGADFPALSDILDSILPYEPDLVLYAMTLNDPVQSPEFHARQRYIDDWILDRGDPRDDASPAFRIWDSRLLAFAGERVTAWQVGRQTTRWYLEMYDAPNRAGWEQTEAAIRDMDRRVRQRGGRLLLTLWPLLVGLDGTYPFAPIHETIRASCLRAGIPEHDLLAAFRGQPSARFWVHPADRHPNEVAHRLAALSLAPVVRDLLRR